MTVDKNNEHESKDNPKNKPGWKKGLWFVGLWFAGVLVLATIGFFIRLVLG